MIDFLRRMFAWFTYRGWRNEWWREDWITATCRHPQEDAFVVNAYSAYCMDCGAPLDPATVR